jgi:hypothetical protein
LLAELYEQPIRRRGATAVAIDDDLAPLERLDVEPEFLDRSTTTGSLFPRSYSHH